MNSPKISILGDSISTFEGCNPLKYDVYYRDSMSIKNQLYTPADTWWYQVIDGLSGQLCINNSFSGCTVSGNSKTSGNNATRAYGMHVGTLMPDIILIYIGINDWGYGIPIGNYDGNGDVPLDVSSFRAAYASMLYKIRTFYFDNVDIWCGTLCKSYIPDDEDWVFPNYNSSLIPLDEYNKAILDIVPHFGANVADIAAFNIPFETLDGAHPSAQGMRTLSKLWLDSLGKSTN